MLLANNKHNTTGVSPNNTNAKILLLRQTRPNQFANRFFTIPALYTQNPRTSVLFCILSNEYIIEVTQ